jgi:hypothetical protein
MSDPKVVGRHFVERLYFFTRRNHHPVDGDRFVLKLAPVSGDMNRTHDRDRHAGAQPVDIAVERQNVT